MRPVVDQVRGAGQKEPEGTLSLGLRGNRSKRQLKWIYAELESQGTLFICSSISHWEDPKNKHWFLKIT